MKLNQIILYSSAALFVIAVHQTFLHGLTAAYSVFMLDGFLFLWYLFLKKKEIDKKEAEKEKK